MDINSNTSLVITVVLATVGFGAAFLIEKIFFKKYEKKAQKILVIMGLASFGYGVTFALYETIAFPLQGLKTNNDKLAIYVIFNIIVLPLVLLLLAKFLIRKKTDELGSNDVVKNSFSKYTILFLLLVIFFLLYLYISSTTNFTARKGNDQPFAEQNSKFSMPNLSKKNDKEKSLLSDNSYDLYMKDDKKSCNLDFDKKPDANFKFSLKQQTNEIYLTLTTFDNTTGQKDTVIQRLESCNVIDQFNWSCGGEVTVRYPSQNYVSSQYTFVDGVFSFKDSSPKLLGKCPVKWVKR
jgi:hypothetical protein